MRKRSQRWAVSLGMFILGAGVTFVAVMSYSSVRSTMHTFYRPQNPDANAMSLNQRQWLTRQIISKINDNKLIMTSTQRPDRKVRILCFVKTHPGNHQTKAVIVRKTWGKRCDKLLFMSSIADPSLPAIGLFSRNYTESRYLLTEKVFRALKYIYTRYLDDYDWFHEADDDTYIIVDNLRGFLATKNPDDPIYFGHRFMKYVPQGYTSGGAGYVMSREALRRIRDRGPQERLCNTRGTASDVHIGHCLNAVGVKLGKSVDSKGRSRYHCFDPTYAIHGGFPKWYKNFTAEADGYRANWIADYPISFHYVDHIMYTLDHILYRTKVHGESRHQRPERD